MAGKELRARKFLSEDSFQWLIVICCNLIFAGFVCSRALASIGMIALLALSLLLQNPVETFKTYLSRKELLILSVFFWIVFLSGFYSDDKTSWLNWVRIKLPYLALPIAFAAIKKLEEKKFISLLYLFIFTLCISAVVVLVNYYLNYEAVNESLLHGNAMPLPFNRHSHISHIRYTLMLVFAFFACWFLLEQKKFLFNKAEKWLQVFLLGFSFVALHVLTVRSSLLALYLAIFFLLLRFIFVQRRILPGIILLALMLAAPFAAVKFIPSLKNKIEYTRYDYFSSQKGEVKDLSDGIRVISMKEGLEIAKQNLWFGVGAGDLKSEMVHRYNLDYPQLAESDQKLPHNQFIWTLATTGVVGLLLFLLAFGYPLFANGNYQNWLLVVLHIILFSSFFTEATLEEQIGTGFYLTFLLVLMNQFRNE